MGVVGRQCHHRNCNSGEAVDLLTAIIAAFRVKDRGTGRKRAALTVRVNTGEKLSVAVIPAQGLSGNKGSTVHGRLTRDRRQGLKFHLAR